MREFGLVADIVILALEKNEVEGNISLIEKCMLPETINYCPLIFLR